MSETRRTYVRSYEPHWVDPAKPLEGPRDHVDFSHSPRHWTLERTAARHLRDRLNMAQMCSVEHECVFDLEELTPGRFVVCCIFHPAYAGAEYAEAVSTETACHVY